MKKQKKVRRRKNRDKSNRKKRIERLKRKSQKQDGGNGRVCVSDKISKNLTEYFRQSVLSYEKAPDTTHFEQIRGEGLELPAPEEMDDEECTSMLWKIIYLLAEKRVFLYSTDHLSDRELYSKLWMDVLHDVVKDIKPSLNSAWHVDFVSTGSEENNHLYLKYYADEKARQEWLAYFPDEHIPDHEDPPYVRDILLPQS